MKTQNQKFYLTLRKTEKSDVELTEIIDEDILGGMIVKMETNN